MSHDMSSLKMNLLQNQTYFRFICLSSPPQVSSSPLTCLVKGAYGVLGTTVFSSSDVSISSLVKTATQSTQRKNAMTFRSTLLEPDSHSRSLWTVLKTLQIVTLRVPVSVSARYSVKLRKDPVNKNSGTYHQNPLNPRLVKSSDSPVTTTIHRVFPWSFEHWLWCMTADLGPVRRCVSLVIDSWSALFSKLAAVQAAVVPLGNWAHIASIAWSLPGLAYNLCQCTCIDLVCSLNFVVLTSVHG